MKPVTGPVTWPYDPAVPSTWPGRNNAGRDGVPALLPMGEAVLTPSADAPQEVASDELVPGEADDQGPE